MSNLIDEINAASLRTDIPAFRPGDTLKVHVKVVEVVPADQIAANREAWLAVWSEAVGA